MPDPLSQDNRIGALTTPLGKDNLVLARIEANESLSECFLYTVDAYSLTKDFDFNQALGKHCTVSIKTFQNQQRHFDGILTETSFLQEFRVSDTATIYTYRLVLRPWFWLLSHRADCRIYSDKTVVEIIEAVFKEAGFSAGTDYDPRLEVSYPKREYCVQYRETDFEFVSRLMEEEGIYYYFEHADQKHTMVLVDSRSQHKPVANLEQGIAYRPLTRESEWQEELLLEWSSNRRFRTGKFELGDRDYLYPEAQLTGKAEGTESYEKSKFEIFDHPGRHGAYDYNKKLSVSDKEKQGERLAKIRLEAEQSGDHRRYAAGHAVSLFPGGRITVLEHKTEKETDFLVVSARHSYRQGDYQSDSTQEPMYHGSYELLPKDQQFRAPQITPAPRINGIQTAKVVKSKSPSADEEIDVDEYGRILVHFYWDRHNEASRRVRVSQPWAQKNWGHIFIPRIGQEVVVEFLEGDPDQPLVTGAVYNDDNKVPYKLPDNRTQSGIKTNSSTNGKGGYNELMFEDKTGSEDIRMHAQKDHDVTVLDTETWTIGEKFTNHKGAASRNATLVKGDDKLDVQSGNRIVHVSDNTTVDVGQVTHITSGKKIQLTCGQSEITMTPMSIDIKSPQITINGTMTTKVTGGITLTLEGGLVLINS